MAGLNIAAAKDVTAQEDEGQVVALLDVSGEPLLWGEKNDQPVTVRIAGSYSARYRATQAAQTQRLLGKRRQKFSEEEFAANRTELVAACVLDWSGVFDGDKPLAPTKDNATRVLLLAPWIRDQLEEAQGDHASFFRAASPS